MRVKIKKIFCRETAYDIKCPLLLAYAHERHQSCLQFWALMAFANWTFALIPNAARHVPQNVTSDKCLANTYCCFIRHLKQNVWSNCCRCLQSLSLSHWSAIRQLAVALAIHITGARPHRLRCHLPVVYL